MKKAIAAAVAAVAAVALTACGTDNNRDLKGVPNTDPDYVVNIINLDGQPNVAVLCFEGQGMLTTTRSYDALTIAPQLNAFCESKIGVKSPKFTNP